MADRSKEPPNWVRHILKGEAILHYHLDQLAVRGHHSCFAAFEAIFIEHFEKVLLACPIQEYYLLVEVSISTGKQLPKVTRNRLVAQWVAILHNSTITMTQ